jgi:flagellar biosynthesis/type III secretory pathway chaperone
MIPMNTNMAENQRREEIKSLCTALRNVLEAELVAIKERNSDELYSLVSQKTTILNQLQNSDTYLSELFSLSVQTDSVLELKESLSECRVLNTKNRTVALLELKHTNKSIEHLRSLLKLDDLPLYAPSGQLTVNREKRNLGTI